MGRQITIPSEEMFAAVINDIRITHKLKNSEGKILVRIFWVNPVLG